MATTGRCYFLELPAEIRLEIYEYLHFDNYDYPNPGDLLPCCANIGTLEWDKAVEYKYSNQATNQVLFRSMAITRVSQQVRQESLPIMWASASTEFFNNDESEGAAARWIQIVDTVALSVMEEFEFGFDDCHNGCCYIRVALYDVEDLVECHEHRYCGRIENIKSKRRRRKTDQKRQEECDTIFDIVDDHPVVNGKCRKMDKDTLLEMLMVMGIVTGQEAKVMRITES